MLGEASSPTAALGARQPACCVCADRAEAARLVDAVLSSPPICQPAPGSANGRVKTHWSRWLTKAWERRLTPLSCYACICKGRAAVRNTSGYERPGPAHPRCQSMNNVQATYDALWQLVRVCISWRRGKSREALLPSPAACRAGAAQLSRNGHGASAVPPVPAVAPDELGRAGVCSPAKGGVAL